MRLSDIKGERVFDVIADIIDPIVSIASDEEAAGIFKPEKKPDGMDPYQFFVSRLKGSLPALIRNHKDDFVAILSTINGVSKEEYTETLTLAKLMSDIVELCTDREFKSFFA